MFIDCVDRAREWEAGPDFMIVVGLSVELELGGMDGPGEDGWGSMSFLEVISVGAITVPFAEPSWDSVLVRLSF